MFKALELGSTIDTDPRHLAALVRSTNTQDLALGGGPKRPTRAYTLSFFDGDANTYRVYVYLARVGADKSGQRGGLLFRSDPADVDLDAYEALQREAGTMVQSQGFQMETIEVGTLEPAERAELLADLPFSNAARVSSPPIVQPAAPNIGGPVEASVVADVSREITLPEAQAITVLGRLLSLF